MGRNRQRPPRGDGIRHLGRRLGDSVTPSGLDSCPGFLNSKLVLQLATDDVSLQILPEFGGKISSLFDKRSRREWLWVNPGMKRKPPVYGASYVTTLDTGGWDEVFPSITPCELPDGTRIPDHGDLVFLPAEVSDPSGAGLTLSSVTRSMRARFTRTLHLQGNVLGIDYQLESLGDREHPYLWAAHPLVALEDGMTLELPTDRLTTSEGLDLEPANPGGCHIRIRDPATGSVPPHHLKCFTARHAASWARLTAADGASLRLDWSSIPHLGIWLNQRGWAGHGKEPYFNLGLEPTTAPCDNLLEAVERNEHFLLKPGETHRWSVRVTLGRGESSP